MNLKWASLLILTLGGLVSAEAATKSKPRRYDEGPLKRTEFRGKAPASSSATAATMTRVMIQYRFETRPHRSRFATRLKSFDVYAVFLPAASWWRNEAGNRLLDHEQGHFDIAEIAARKLQLALRRTQKTSSPLQGFGFEPRRAERDLADKVRKLLQQINDQAVEDNQAYDRATLHGAAVAQQREWRRVQQATLNQLDKQLHPQRSGRQNRNNPLPTRTAPLP